MDREDVDHMVQRRWIWMFILVCLMIPRGVYSQTAEEGDMEALHAPVESPQRQRAPDLSAVVQLVLRRTNDLRHQEGCPPVDPNPKLTQTAQYFANYMARTNKYGHTADGSRPGERARKHGYDSCMVSENIAYQYSSTGLTTDELAEAFFEGWKQSAEHRKNMLDADATETGLAVAQSDETSYYYAVQMFGRPSSQRIEFQIVNRSAAAISYEIGGRSFTLPPQYARTHQQCRPAALRFRWPDGAQTPPKQESQTIHPRDGERYTIIQSEAGQFSVQRE